MNNILDTTLELTKNDLLYNRKEPENCTFSYLHIAQVLISFADSLLVNILPELQSELSSIVSFERFLNGPAPLTPLTFSDSISGALFTASCHFITSLNCEFIPELPMGSTRDLYCQSDAHYGPDNPMCWPQPFNQQYPFIAAVSKRPLSSSDSQIMWVDLKLEDLEFSNLGSTWNKGVLKDHLV
ncbi:hypothetical protein GYMLUDRAFT_59374 [Collybiopsis luxurians FD-317 M1]|uniref:Uncharacterized protein n=1 Tax=Collybiopsis luxurians FD-317 M1 TaxID=944289 RepID=A0A0D0BA96_9AGAR|nr:hypothetical protein GYMLUDRAFT_59374 [Collybiopsis luxurians FD-317 M1]